MRVRIETKVTDQSQIHEGNCVSMTKEDRNHAEARMGKIARAAHDAKTGKSDRDASANAVLTNMARLKALRLAREAAAPPPAAVTKKARAKPAKSDKSADKATLAQWLESQKTAGWRT